MRLYRQHNYRRMRLNRELAQQSGGLSNMWTSFRNMEELTMDSEFRHGIYFCAGTTTLKWFADQFEPGALYASWWMGLRSHPYHRPCTMDHTPWTMEDHGRWTMARLCDLVFSPLSVGYAARQA